MASPQAAPAWRWRSMLRPLFFLLCAAGSAAITAGSVGYFDPDEWPAFVIEKLPLATERLETLWLLALRVHVVAAAFALPGCLLLCSQRLMRKAPAAHRWLGRMVGVVVLGMLCPSGLIMAFFAKAGVWSTVGFILTGIITGGAMLWGIRQARRRNFVAHRRAVFHVLAQLSVAVTSRAMLFALHAAGMEPDAAYLLALWLPVVGSALAVELAVRGPPLPLSVWRSHARQVSPSVSLSGLVAEPTRPGQ